MQSPRSPRSVVSNLERPSSSSSSSASSSQNGGNTILFPWKLHEMLRNCVTEGKDNIVSWLPEGNAFKVHKVPDFVSKILPMYFKQTKYKSFQRQLNLWGFERLTSGPDKGAYYHDQFLRDDPDLCSKLTRQRARKPGAAAAEGGTTTPAAGPSSTKSLKPTNTTPPKPKQQRPTKKAGATKRASSITNRQPIIVQPALGVPPDHLLLVLLYQNQQQELQQGHH